jgi:plastocyanin
VALASGGPGSWSVEEVAPLAEDTGDQTGTEAVPTLPTTSVAVDSQGVTWVAWQDPAGIHLASSGDEGFEEVDLPDTSGGVTPSLAVTDDGASGYLAWYDTTEGDLRLGTYGELEDLLIAAPPPLPSPQIGGAVGCGEDGQIVLDIVAQGTAFLPTCLVAPAGEPFTINFDNRDPATVGQHNIAIAVDEESVVEDPIFKGDLITGPDSVEYSVPAIDEGDYFFHCDIHPQMTGALAVVAGGGGGGGGNGGGGNGDGGGG